MPTYFFIWDEETERHLAEHGVTPEEFEEVVQDDLAHRMKSRSTGRPLAIGWTSTGKCLHCVYELDEDDITVIPITAYEVDEE